MNLHNNDIMFFSSAALPFLSFLACSPCIMSAVLCMVSMRALERLHGLRREDINNEALEGRRADLHQIGKQRQSDAHFAESRPGDEGVGSDGGGIISV